jgi:hypothetical protein
MIMPTINVDIAIGIGFAVVIALLCVGGVLAFSRWFNLF